MDLASLLPYVPAAALLVSLAALGLGVINYRKTVLLQKFDYSPNIEVNTIRCNYNNASPTRPALEYAARIQNKGAKPSQIARVILDCHSGDMLKKRVSYGVRDEFYLSPGEATEIKFNLDMDFVRRAQGEVASSEVIFVLRVVARTAEGKTIERVLDFGGFHDDAPMVFMRKRDMPYIHEDKEPVVSISSEIRMNTHGKDTIANSAEATASPMKREAAPKDH